MLKNNQEMIEKEIKEFFEAFYDEDEPYPWVSGRGDYSKEIREVLEITLKQVLKFQAVKWAKEIKKEIEAVKEKME